MHNFDNNVTHVDEFMAHIVQNAAVLLMGSITYGEGEAVTE